MFASVFSVGRFKMLCCTFVACAAANNEIKAAKMGGEVEVCDGETELLDCR
jgi:hypothetical protein